MSLKFGIYLVEQRIISPEQFCGLVKIQQEAGASIATVAIRKNMLTIKQVARILDQQELSPSRSFIEIAIESDFLDRADADQLVQEQRNSSPTIQRRPPSAMAPSSFATTVWQRPDLYGLAVSWERSIQSWLVVLAFKKCCHPVCY